MTNHVYGSENFQSRNEHFLDGVETKKLHVTRQIFISDNVAYNREIWLKRLIEEKTRTCPGFEPGSDTLSRNHTSRPVSINVCDADSNALREI